MGSVKGGQEGSTSRLPTSTDFVLPSKTSSAIKVKTPSSTKTQVSHAPSSLKGQDRSRSASPSASSQSPLFIPPQKLGKPKYLEARFNTPSVTDVPNISTIKAVRPDQATDDATTISRHETTPDLPRSPPESASSNLDIHAANYIPKWLIAINAAPATTVYCRPLDTVDFARYIGSFAGHDILTSITKLALPPMRAVQPRIKSTPEDLLPCVYGEYFSDALQNEIKALSRELRAYSMYNVNCIIEDLGQELFRFNIPGLREYSPRVVLGDVVLVRPIGPYAAQAPMYNTVEYQAIVWGVSRAKEQILLRIDGFGQNWAPACNLIFVVQGAHCAQQWRSIETTTSLLNDMNGLGSPWLYGMLFPDTQHGKIQTMLPRGTFDLDWYDSQLNYEQRKTIDGIVQAKYGLVPYLINGPPGTGKTKTIVETTLQLLKSQSEVTLPHLLVCAPSDPAADTLTGRLSKHLTPKELFRLNGYTRSFAEVPDSLLPYTVAENDLFSLPKFETLMQYKVVVTTCKDADMLAEARLTNDCLTTLMSKTISAIAPNVTLSLNPDKLVHWTALLLDEAAQATEPETLIAVSVVCPTPAQKLPGAVQDHPISAIPQLVMAGDQHQLGPRLSSTGESPLATSLLARLLKRPFYHAHPLSRSNGSRPLTSTMLPMPIPAFTNLVRNYRSRPAILTTPSSLFYNDTLIPEFTSLSLLVESWPGWQVTRKDCEPTWPGWTTDIINISRASMVLWPVLFYQNSTPDALESILTGKGSGLFNAGEATAAFKIVDSLLKWCVPSTGERLAQREIAIMSPFQAQVNHLRKVFREGGLHDINIGPLEAFQGLESRIVIICTTRTRLGPDQAKDKFVLEDKAKGLGLIDEPKCFNVALTRAKEGLIVLGDVACLTCTGDTSWLEFIAYCKRNKRIVDCSNEKRTADFSYLGKRGRLERALQYAEGADNREQLRKTTKNAAPNKTISSHGNASRLPKLKGQLRSLDDEMWRMGLAASEEMDEKDLESDDDLETRNEGSPPDESKFQEGTLLHPLDTPQGENTKTANATEGRIRDPFKTLVPSTLQVAPRSSNESTATTTRSSSAGLFVSRDDPANTSGKLRGKTRLDEMKSGGEVDGSVLVGRSQEDEKYDHDPEKEFEKADCATQ